MFVNQSSVCNQLRGCRSFRGRALVMRSDRPRCVYRGLVEIPAIGPTRRFARPRRPFLCNVVCECLAFRLTLDCGWLLESSISQRIHTARISREGSVPWLVGISV